MMNLRFPASLPMASPRPAYNSQFSCFMIGVMVMNKQLRPMGRLYMLALPIVLLSTLAGQTRADFGFGFMMQNNAYQETQFQHSWALQNAAAAAANRPQPLTAPRFQVRDEGFLERHDLATRESMVNRINADLANEFGNLAQRSLSMVAKNLDGIVPRPGDFTDDDRALLARASDDLLSTVRAHFDVPAMNLALEAIWAILAEANRYFSAQEPWVLRKSDADADQDRFRTVLYTTLEVVRVAALLTQPVMPESAAKLLDLLGQPDELRTFAAIGTALAPGTALPAPVGVFPRFQVE